MRIKKAIIVGLMLPLVSEICAVPASAVSYMGTATSRPSTTARMPTLLTTASTYSSATASSSSAGLLATCANPLPDRLPANRCISKYEGCLYSEYVCGEHFELCYNLKQFNKARIMCQEILAQCPADAVEAIFGNSVTTSNDLASANRTMCEGESVLTKRTFSPALNDIAVAANSRIDLAIKDGKNWAAANSVKTCNNIADACIQNACKNSPQKCISVDGFSDIDTDEMVNIATSGETTLRLNANMLQTWIANMGWNDSNVKNYIKEQCRDTVGANEYCYMVTNGTPAKEVDLTDSFNIQDVYQDIMFSGVGARWKMSQSKIKEWAAKAAKKSVEQCNDAFRDCAVNACGEGSLARCYGLAKETNSVSIRNRAGTSIEGQCKNLIENNQYCKDVFFNKETGSEGDVWEQIWEEDIVGAVIGLDTELMESFNEEAVAKLRSGCQAQVEKCVQTECGTDFSRCFITSSAAKKSGNITFSGGTATSKLYAGGFDETLARDLCILDVKKYDDCNKYFDVQYAKQSSGKSADSWSASSNARNAWLNASNQSAVDDSVCRTSTTYSNLVDEYGNSIDATKSVSAGTKECATQEREIFDGLLADISKRANSVLEREANDLKNECEALNVKGSAQKDYVWASLDDFDSSDEFDGFSSVTETSDPFNGFCAVKVVVRSNNDKVIKALGGNRIMYYPKGISIQCLGGITTEDWESIERSVAADVKFCAKGETSATHGCVEKLSGLQKTLRIGGTAIGSAVGVGLLGTLGINAMNNARAAKNPTTSDNQGNEIVGVKKTNLLNMDNISIGGMAATAGIAGAIGSVISANAINQKEDRKLDEAQQQAITDFLATTDINCYIGGKKVASYSKDMDVK